MLITFIQNIFVGSLWGERALIHPGLEGSCCNLVFLTDMGGKKREGKKMSRNFQSAFLVCTSCCSHSFTYITWTTTPMPETASLSTALSIAWEMVSNRSSGSCKKKDFYQISAARTTKVKVLYISHTVKEKVTYLTFSLFDKILRSER